MMVRTRLCLFEVVIDIENIMFASEEKGEQVFNAPLGAAYRTFHTYAPTHF